VIRATCRAACFDVRGVVPPEWRSTRCASRRKDGGRSRVGRLAVCERTDQLVDGQQLAISDDLADSGGILDAPERVAVDQQQIGQRARGDDSQGLPEELTGDQAGSASCAVGESCPVAWASGVVRPEPRSNM